ncbi:MAG: chemotaxis protein CheD [Moraxellaceae bacterium]|nr:chemotaxis protein CheD [Moraxellaceae bacterium]
MAVINVSPGQIAIGHSKDELRTLLGSCVAITLWQPQRHVGAMCHIVLPARNLPPGRRGLDARFADEAWVKMSVALAAQGVAAADCECKVFGGARVFSHEFANMGARNVASVRALLHNVGVQIANEHVGGNGYRELRFDILTGDAWMRHRSAHFPKSLRETTP